MSKDETTLLDIDVAAQRVLEFVRGYTFERFAADEKTWSAVLYQVGVIGEAVKSLSDPFRAANSSIPWSQISGMRTGLSTATTLWTSSASGKRSPNRFRHFARHSRRFCLKRAMTNGTQKA
jgi:Ribonuclease HepT-like